MRRSVKSIMCNNHIRKYTGYTEWHTWAEEQNKNGINQAQCPDCGLFLFPQESGLTFYRDFMRHLVCEPYSIDNLHWMAELLGIKKCWFHKDHYDIPLKMLPKIETMKFITLVSPRKIFKIVRTPLIP